MDNTMGIDVCKKCYSFMIYDGYDLYNENFLVYYFFCEKCNKTYYRIIPKEVI